MSKVFVYDPTASDKLSSVRGVGRYLQILKENFPEWNFSSHLPTTHYSLQPIFINPFFNLLQPPLTMRRIANKQIAIIHDLIPLKYPEHFPAGIKGNINIFLNKLSLKNYDMIITDSEASKQDIINILRIEESKIKVIYPCLPKSFGKNKTTPYLLPPTPYCLYVGDATWNKNLVNLARAIKIANVTCVFVGKVFQKTTNYPLLTTHYSNPWLSELKKFLELAKNDKQFIFAGFVPDSELIKLYKQASFNILPSRDEGFGFSYLEAANFSCPSLISDIPVLKEISDGKAIFFDPNDPKKTAEKIKTIYSDKGLRNKIGEETKKRSEFFSAEKFKKEFQKNIQFLFML